MGGSKNKMSFDNEEIFAPFVSTQLEKQVKSTKENL